MTRRLLLPTLATLFLLTLTACKGVVPPLAVGHTESLAGQGMVLTLTNTSEEHLHDLAVTIEAPDGDQKTYAIATLEPHESTRVGWLRLDGWPIPAGAKISVKVKDYLLPARHTT